MASCCVIVLCAPLATSSIDVAYSAMGTLYDEIEEAHPEQVAVYACGRLTYSMPHYQPTQPKRVLSEPGTAYARTLRSPTHEFLSYTHVKDRGQSPYLPTHVLDSPQYSSRVWCYRLRPVLTSDTLLPGPEADEMMFKSARSPALESVRYLPTRPIHAARY
eukprot:3685951-Rhodomonas_salina.3